MHSFKSWSCIILEVLKIQTWSFLLIPYAVLDQMQCSFYHKAQTVAAVIVFFTFIHLY